MLVVDPATLAAEPIETCASPAGVRQVCDGSSDLRQASVYRRGRKNRPAETSFIRRTNFRGSLRDSGHASRRQKCPELSWWRAAPGAPAPILRTFGKL